MQGRVYLLNDDVSVCAKTREKRWERREGIQQLLELSGVIFPHAFPVLNEALGIGLGEAEAALVLFVAEHAELEAAQAIVLHLFFDVTLEFESGLGCLRQVASEQQTTAVTCVQEEAGRVVLLSGHSQQVNSQNSRIMAHSVAYR